MKTKVILLLSLVVLSLALVSCATPPVSRVDSYEEIQEALKDQSDIAFPDISLQEERYRQCDFNYEIKFNQFNRKVRTGYTVYFAQTPSARELMSGLVTPEEFIVGATSLEKFYDDRNRPELLDLNSEHRGVALQEALWDNTPSILSEDSGTRWLREQDPYFPTEQLKLIVQAYRFDLDGYRYYVSMQFLFLHDEAEDLSPEEKVTPFKEELLGIVDSILDERGIKR